MKKLITLSLVAFLGLFSIAPMVGCTGDEEGGDNTEENGDDKKEGDDKKDGE